MIENIYGNGIFTEPGEVDGNTLANLGPLSRLAGKWRGSKGIDVNPKAAGPVTQGYLETIDLEPIDPQLNGPQLLYGLRYHQHLVKPGEIETYHDQVGYWLWEPAAGIVVQTLAIPHGQTLLASGKASSSSPRFELRARHGSPTNGIVSGEFLEHAFLTTEYRIAITLNDDGSWSYDVDTVLMVKGRQDPFHHTDRNTLVKIAEPRPNPVARAAQRPAQEIPESLGRLRRGRR